MFGRGKGKALRPAGHSAFIESLIQPAIVVGSTLMSTVSAYVLGQDEFQRIVTRQGSLLDGVIVGMCVGLGFLVDMAIIVSATRYKMYVIRNEKDERWWLVLSLAVLLLGLLSESMTLLYFFIVVAGSSVPPEMKTFLTGVHTVLETSRGFLPPFIIVYFAAGVMPVIITRKDRNREMVSRASQGIATIMDMFMEVKRSDNNVDMLMKLQVLMLLERYFLSDDASANLDEAKQEERDMKFLQMLAQLSGVNWSEMEQKIGDKGNPAQELKQIVEAEVIEAEAIVAEKVPAKTNDEQVIDADEAPKVSEPGRKRLTKDQKKKVEDWAKGEEVTA